MGFIRNNRIAIYTKACFSRHGVYFIFIAVSLLVASMPLHEFGHGLACMYLGLEILRFDLIDGKVNCTLVPGGPHLLVLLAGGALPAALFSVLLALGKIRKVKHARYALIVAIAAQATHASLESLAYEAYTHFDLGNQLIAPGMFVMILAIVLCGSFRAPPMGLPNPA